MSDKNHILNIFKDTGALLEGHFILSSGKHSSKYFQCAKVLQYPEYLTAFSIMIADEFEGQKPDVVISPAIGGIVLGTEVGTQLGCRTIFSERKNGTMVIRRGFNLTSDEIVKITKSKVKRKFYLENYPALSFTYSFKDLMRIFLKAIAP